MAQARRKLIAPSILSADFGRLAEEVRAVEAAGADWLHVDVMDGHFVPNITVGPMVVRAARAACALPLDVHLMIEEPDRHLAAFAEAGAHLITVHAEVPHHLHRTLQSVRALGRKVGVALNPATPLAAVEEVLGEVDLVLVMSVNPGFGGQEFLPGSLDKVRRLRRMLDEGAHRALIEVDGGVGPENAGALREAGADVLVAGTSVFGSGDYRRAVRSLRGEG
ncbi:MAG: ribulose-phosphate 3-epimerase [Nitrospinota bacterium]